MSYTNPRHEGRLTLIQHLRDAFASMYVHGNVINFGNYP
mgnify:CR=1 FL=1